MVVPPYVSIDSLVTFHTCHATSSAARFVAARLGDFVLGQNGGATITVKLTKLFISIISMSMCV